MKVFIYLFFLFLFNYNVRCIDILDKLNSVIKQEDLGKRENFPDSIKVMLNEPLTGYKNKQLTKSDDLNFDEISKLTRSVKSNAILGDIFVNKEGVSVRAPIKFKYDHIRNEFIVPEEVIKEDDLSKFRRVKSVLESMKIEDIEKKLPVFMNPPILRGFETKLLQINKKDKTRKNEKILNSIIKKQDDDSYFTKLKDKAKNKIIIPPNFLY